MGRLTTMLLAAAALLGACAPGDGAPSAGGAGDGAAGAAPVDRDAWWNGATRRASGTERILAPRELRALLAEGRGRGLHRDSEWWSRRAKWAYERILALDPEDVEANAGVGRRTLRSIPGFEETWRRMEETRTPNGLILELFDRYGGAVGAGEPVFLFEQEYEVAQARLQEAAAHLDRLASDPEYAALQNALRFVRSSHHADYAFVHRKVGPFLVFYAARDLQRILGEDPAAEDERLAGRRAFYLRRLDAWTPVYADLVADLRELYPRVWERHALAPDAIFPQWIFAERSSYVDFLARLHLDRPERPYRDGFYQPSSGWAYLVEPTAPAGGGAGDAEDGEPKEDHAADASGGLRETAAYLGAKQILYHWGRDAEVPLRNHVDRSEDLWLKEGWPSFVAARRVEDARVGRALLAAHGQGVAPPPLLPVLERRAGAGSVAASGGGDGMEAVFTDRAWLLVRYLNADERRPAFERFLLEQVGGGRRGIDFLEECFSIEGYEAWEDLERRVYETIGKK